MRIKQGSAATAPFNVLWLQAASCGGCTMAALESGASGWLADMAAFGVRLLWHPSVSEESGSAALAIFDSVLEGRTPLQALVVEGAALCGPDGSGRFQIMGGTGQPMLRWIERLAAHADHVVAAGSCAAFGGAPMAGANPTDARGLQFRGAEPGGVLGEAFRSRSGLPVVNIAGCAPHPDWIAGTLAALALGDLDADGLDGFGRPKFFAAHLAHHGCARNEFYEFKASAEVLSHGGCLMEHLGCKATQAVGDCNQRGWNGRGSCTRGGFPCIGCTTPGFEAAEAMLATAKVAGIPLGLPLDMPKAWFVALAALSKSATPKRVSANAAAPRIVVAPSPGTARRK